MRAQVWNLEKSEKKIDVLDTTRACEEIVLSYNTVEEYTLVIERKSMCAPLARIWIRQSKTGEGRIRGNVTKWYNGRCEAT